MSGWFYSAGISLLLLRGSVIFDFLASTCMEFSTSGRMVCIYSDGSRLAKSQNHATLSPDDIVAPIEREIRTLVNSLTSVKDEQEYIVIRERTHRNTAESTNARVKWWSVLQAFVLFSVVAWQVYYLKVRSLGSVNMHWLIKAVFSVVFRDKACNMTLSIWQWPSSWHDHIF